MQSGFFVNSSIPSTAFPSVPPTRCPFAALYPPALSAGRYETKTTILVRRRLRKSGLDSGIIGGGSGSGGHGSPQITDGVELTLLSDGGDAGGMSPRSSRHGGGSGGISSSSGQSVGGSSRREASKNPPQSLRPPTFYL